MERASRCTVGGVLVYSAAERKASLIWELGCVPVHWHCVFDLCLLGLGLLTNSDSKKLESYTFRQKNRLEHSLNLEQAVVNETEISLVSRDLNCFYCSAQGTMSHSGGSTAHCLLLYKTDRVQTKLRSMKIPGLFQKRVRSAMRGHGAPCSLGSWWICRGNSLLGVFRLIAQGMSWVLS